MVAPVISDVNPENLEVGELTAGISARGLQTSGIVLTDDSIDMSDERHPRPSRRSMTIDDEDTEVSTSDQATIEEYEKQIARHPDNPTSYIALALLFHRKNEDEQALSHLERALTLDPTHFNALMKKAQVLLEADELLRAEEVVVTLEHHFARALDTYVLRAELLRKQDAINDALETLLQALVDWPKAHKLHYMLGVLHLETGDINLAVRHLRRATRLASSFAPYYEALGFAQNRRQQISDAARSFDTALHLAPTLHQSMLARASIFSKRGQYQEALDVVDKVPEYSPSYMKAREIVAASCYRLKEYSRARHELSALEIEYRRLGNRRRALHARTMSNLSVVNWEMNRVDEARKWAESALRLFHPSSPNTYVLLLHIYLSQGELDRALGLLSSIPVEYKSDPYVALKVSEVHTRNRDYPKAIRELRPIVDRDTAPDITIATLGALLTDAQPNFKEAEQVLKKGLARLPASVVIINNLAYLYLQMDKIESAQATLKMWPKSIPLTTEGMATTGLLAIKLGRLQEGLNRYEQAASLARRSGNTDYASVVVQKMRLESARAAVESQDPESARRELRRGLAETIPSVYRDQLAELWNTLG